MAEVVAEVVDEDRADDVEVVDPEVLVEVRLRSEVELNIDVVEDMEDEAVVLEVVELVL